jgi:Protein of unknown function (DUF5132)
MQIHLGSLLVGLGAAFAIPLISRVIRPLAVEAIVAGIGLFEEGRRVLAEQVEVMEDIAAEARARREQLLMAAETNGAEPEPEEVSVSARPRRRANGTAVRRQPS